MSYLADLEALTADEYRDEAERERRLDAEADSDAEGVA